MIPRALSGLQLTLQSVHMSFLLRFCQHCSAGCSRYWHSKQLKWPLAQAMSSAMDSSFPFPQFTQLGGKIKSLVRIILKVSLQYWYQDGLLTLNKCVHKFGIIWIKNALYLVIENWRELDYGLHRHILSMSASKGRFEMLLFNIALIVASIFQSLILKFFFSFSSGLC